MCFGRGFGLDYLNIELISAPSVLYNMTARLDLYVIQVEEAADRVLNRMDTKDDTMEQALEAVMPDYNLADAADVKYLLQGGSLRGDR